jgi:hypothetical protein
VTLCLHGPKDNLVAVVLINKLQLSCTFTVFPAAARLASVLSSPLHRPSVAHERRASGALVKQLLAAGLTSCWPDGTRRRPYSLPWVAACPVKFWRRWARRA